MTAFESYRLETVEANGVRLFVRHAGEGPAVLLMHGWCGSSHTWRKVAPSLSADYRVVVPDMRGYGRSEKPERGYDAASGADDMAALLDRLGIERAHVVGHDMGAPVALLFAARFPQRTLSLAYVDEPLLGFDTERYTAFTDWNHGGYWQFGLHAMPGLAELVYAGREEQILAVLLRAMAAVPDAFNDGDIREYAYGMQQSDGIAGMAGWYRAAHETGRQIEDLARRSAVTAATVAIRGERGVAGIAREIRAAVPHAYGVTVPGCGHLVPEEKPAECEALLRQHFALADDAAERAHVVRIALSAWHAMADGFRTGDFAAYLAQVTDHYSFRLPVGPYREPHHGRDEAARYYRSLNAAGVRMTFSEPTLVAFAGQNVVIEYADRGNVGGEPYANRIVGVFAVDGDRIASYREYFGTVDSQSIARMEATPK